MTSAPFKAKRVIDAGGLHDAISGEMGHLPRTSGHTPSASQATNATQTTQTTKAEPLVQFTFRCSLPMGQVLNQMAEAKGGMRRALAQLLRDAGKTIPDHDISPPTGGRRKL